MRGLMFLPFVILTFCCWGLYGPALHAGQAAFGDDGKLSAFRPFVCVGLAYFLIAVIFPAVVLKVRGEKGYWSVTGFIWSFVAGAVGALGALGIILALKSGGSPIYVMPLVFGCAPVVNTFVTMFMAKNFKEASWPFYVGIMVVAIGAAGVLVNKPAKPHAHATSPPAVVASEDVATNEIATGEISVAVATTEDQTEAARLVSFTPAANVIDETNATTAANATTETGAADDAHAETATVSAADGFMDWVRRALFILATACCWGAYGPVLHKGQVVMGGSRLRPFLCVGLAYFAVAVVLPFVLQPLFEQEPGAWSLTHHFGMGYVWSLFAGAIGALGALGIIYAFNFGGKPIFVMPLVFGCAPVVNTFWEISSKNLWEEVQPGFFMSLFLVIAGAVTVLLTAPKAGPKTKEKPAPPEKTEPAAGS